MGLIMMLGHCRGELYRSVTGHLWINSHLCSMAADTDNTHREKFDVIYSIFLKGPFLKSDYGLNM